MKNSAEKKAVASTQLADVLRQAIAYYEKAEQTIMSQSVCVCVR
ncbi:MAG: hypothetical protein PUA62_10030 [Lachnospiraceae bacterium]|nr:hypothetical protein [Lachnospiraceae bacterium]